MSKPTAYTFTVLRYVHDIVSGEFLNVGVVLHSASARVLSAKVRNTYSRLSKAFPTISGDSYRRTVGYVEQAISQLAAGDDDLFRDLKGNAEIFARRVLPNDDSSFQWSPMGSGVAADLTSELDDIFDRMVMAHDAKPQLKSRSEDDVWRTFSRALETRQVLRHLSPKEISSESDRHVFSHAWKNGVWNCLVPISFDLVDGERIHEKALRWVGQAQALRKASDAFKLYMLVGSPRETKVNDAYARALKVLETMTVDKEIVLEEQAEQLSDHIAKDILDHQRIIESGTT